MERREISKEVYDKIIKQIPNPIIEMLPDKPENLLKYATRIKEIQFSKMLMTYQKINERKIIK